MGSCFYPMAHENEVGGCWEITEFPTLPTSTGLDTGYETIGTEGKYGLTARPKSG